MKYILSLLLMLVTIPSFAGIVSHNLVGNASDITLTKNYNEGSGMGEIKVQLCSECISRVLTITPETKVFKAGKPIELHQLKTYLNANRKASMRLQFHNVKKHVYYIKLELVNKEYPQ